jgi:catechol 2,3-dioxygenase-like lactoylglutathione lyase family enzyme
LDISFQSSVILVKDIQASRQFYEGLLGQKVLMDHGPNVGFAGGFAIWQIDHAWQIIGHKPTVEPGPLGRSNLELYFESEDVETVAARLIEGGVPEVHPLREQPWGQRVVRFYDPDGHIIEIGEPMPAVIRRFLGQGLAAAEVAQQLSMPLEVVQQIAENLEDA